MQVGRGTSDIWDGLFKHSPERSMRGFGAATYVPQSSENHENGWRWPAVEAGHFKLLQELSERYRIEHAALAPQVPACPANASVGKTYCYDGPVPLLPPGMFYAIGLVPFHINEFKPGTRYSFTKTITPDPTQREIIEYFVIKRSATYLAKQLATAILRGKLTPKPSVQQAMFAAPGFKLTIPGFERFPIAPTSDEMTGYDGLAKWFARGGYPLMAEVTNGTVSLEESFSPTVCASIFCRCDADPNPLHAKVSCVRAFVTKDGAVSQHPGSDGASFWQYYKFDPSGRITLLLDYDDPSKLEQFGQAMAKMLSWIGDIFCTSAPVAKDQLNKLTLPKCATPENKPCKQGEKNCKCITVNASTSVAVTATNIYAQQWCNGWIQQQAATPDYPVDNIIPAPEAKPVPWAWIIGGAVVVGGLLYAKNR